MWKTQTDLSEIFQELMSECDEVLEVNNKSRYIKFKHNSSIGESGESEEQGEVEEATGGETAVDENAAEQIFLETTV